MTDSIDSQLSNLVRDPSLEKLSLTLKTPNLFDILKITNHEIRHSNFLAWLLSPNEGHNLNSIFLKWFLKEIFQSGKINWANEFLVDSLDLNKVEVFREWRNIDILIVHDNFVLVIENKYNSREHSNQLRRYKEKINKYYKNKNKGFVFLTRHGDHPEDANESDAYISIDYQIIKSRIEIVLDNYSNSISQKVISYIQDYLVILNREIMEEHESIDLARQLYKNHKEAIDFILEHRPDRVLEIKDTVERAIKSIGYKLETCGKYHARFLTEELSQIIPRNGEGWGGKESFLFELAYNTDHIKFQTVLSPGNQQTRETLRKILSRIEETKKPKGKSWLVHYSDRKRIDLTNEKYDEPKEIEKLVKDLLKKNEHIIKKVENAIMEVKSEL